MWMLSPPSSPALKIFRAPYLFLVYPAAFRSFLKVVMYISMSPSFMQSVWISFSALTPLAMSVKVSLKVLVNSSQSSLSFWAYPWVSFLSMASCCSLAQSSTFLLQMQLRHNATHLQRMQKAGFLSFNFHHLMQECINFLALSLLTLKALGVEPSRLVLFEGAGASGGFWMVIVVLASANISGVVM